MKNLQQDKNKKLQHLLSIEGLNKDIVERIFNDADKFLENKDTEFDGYTSLSGKTVCNLFFENSTRTQTTFEIAAKRLSANVINLDIATSSQSKGESILDLINNLIAMSVDIFVIRHSKPGIPELIAKNIKSDAHIINAGDGNREHPTQGLLDAFTIREFKKDFSTLKVAIVGDIEHSRVAKSQINILATLGAKEIRVIGPKSLMPRNIDDLDVNVFNTMEEGLKDVDVVMMLRIQKERMSNKTVPSESNYFKSFGLNQKRLKIAKDDAIVLHPGPINRGVEIESKVADGMQSVILNQVKNGIAIRMAVMAMMVGNK
ncbi:aspartate carbamoyltransferase catalytic subunit [Methylophilaceae bacterium]|nr:aspartate carbamoyltransferase catalytic subunit [Methylophilaceae bacterium]|tara:strand:+ start:144 stop:1094 length:951 start_codon:yes stop_codon:yes gene_type:complete